MGRKPKIIPPIDGPLEEILDAVVADTEEPRKKRLLRNQIADRKFLTWINETGILSSFARPHPPPGPPHEAKAPLPSQEAGLLLCTQKYVD